MAVAMNVSVYAQLSGDGYYRVKNHLTSRYITINDNTGSVDFIKRMVDFGALQSVPHFENIVSNPGSIVYIHKVSAGQYSLASQGTNTVEITSRTLSLMLGNYPNTYRAFGSESGVTLYLDDEYDWTDPTYENIGNLNSSTSEARDWYILPVKADEEERYFGVKPDVEYDGGFYTTLYAYFPYNFHSTGMKAMKVTKVVNGFAIYQEVDGTVPIGSAVIIKCSSSNYANNRLNIVDQQVGALQENLLKGVYFCYHRTGHINRVAYDPSTMRVLGKTSDGKLGFVKVSTTSEYLSHNGGMAYLPANKAYLQVSADTPAELELVTEEEYNERIVGVDQLTVDSKVAKRGVYTLSGQYLGMSTDNLAKGVYVVNGQKTVVK